MAREGDNVQFECKSNGFTKWLMWDKKSDILMKLPGNVEVARNILIIRNITPRNFGIYECQGELSECYNGSNKRAKFAARSALIYSELFLIYFCTNLGELHIKIYL